jgi:anti-anti-sigma regulatory factor
MSSRDKTASRLFNIRIDKDIVLLHPLDKAFLNSQAKEFTLIFEDLKKKGYKKYILDFSQCDYISSEGLSITALCWKWCHDEGNGSMAAVVPDDSSNEVRKLFEIIGLSRMIGSALQPKIATAVTYLRNFSS